MGAGVELAVHALVLMTDELMTRLLANVESCFN